MSLELSLVRSNNSFQIDIWTIIYVASILYLLYRLYSIETKTSKLEANIVSASGGLTDIINMTNTYTETLNSLHKRLETIQNDTLYTIDQYDIQMDVISNRLSCIEKVNKDIEKNIDVIKTDLEKKFTLVINTQNINTNIIETIEDRLKHIDSQIQEINGQVSEDLSKQIEIVSKVNDINKTITTQIDKQIKDKLDEYATDEEFNGENYYPIIVLFEKYRNVDLEDYYDFLYKYYPEFVTMCKGLINTTKSEAVGKFTQGIFRSDGYINICMLNYILSKSGLEIGETINIKVIAENPYAISSDSMFMFNRREKIYKLYDIYRIRSITSFIEYKNTGYDYIEKSSVNRIWLNGAVNDYVLTYKIEN